MAKHEHLHTLDINERYDEDLWRAINRAAEAHQHQRRKNTGEFYIAHPFAALQHVRSVTNDVNIQIGTILHDTVEDTDLTLDEIAAEFGDEVAHYVWGVTKDDTIPDWRERNQAYLQRLEYSAADGSVIIALGDKIANIEDQIRDYKKLGYGMWQKFNAGPADQLWWFTAALEVAERRLPGCPLTKQLGELLYQYATEVVRPSIKQ